VGVSKKNQDEELQAHLTTNTGQQYNNREAGSRLASCRYFPRILLKIFWNWEASPLCAADDNALKTDVDVLKRACGHKHTQQGRQ
jgi:hypothetical protein